MPDLLNINFVLLLLLLTVDGYFFTSKVLYLIKMNNEVVISSNIDSPLISLFTEIYISVYTKNVKVS